MIFKVFFLNYFITKENEFDEDSSIFIIFKGEIDIC